MHLYNGINKKLAAGGMIKMRFAFGPKKNSRQYFYNLFLSIAVFSVFLIIVLSLSLYFNFRGYSLDVINKSNEKTLVQISNSILQVDYYARTFTASLFKNADAVTLMCGENVDIYDSMNSRKAIDDLIKGIPFIHSVYLYDGRTGTYYTMGPNPVMRSGANFYDGDIVKIIDRTNAKVHPTPLARRVPNGDLASMGTSDIYSYIITDFFAGTDNVKNAVVVNILFDWVYDTQATVNPQISGNARNNIVIIDKSGRVVGHSLGRLFLADFSGREYIRRILSSNAVSGSIIADYDGVRSVVTYVYVKDLQWYMLSVTPYNYAASSVVKVENITILICLLLTAVALALAFLLSRQLYSPVRLLGNKALELMGRQPQPKERLRANEFEAIESLFSTTTNRLASLEDFKSKNLRQLKAETLRDFLLHKPDVAPAGEKMRELDISISQHDTVLLVLFRLDGYEQFRARFDSAAQAQRKEELCNLSLEVCSRETSGEAVDLGGDQIVLFLNAGKGLIPEGIVTEALMSCIREIRELFLTYCSQSVSAFISPSANDLGEIPALYQKVLLLSNYRIIYGQGCVLTEKDMEKCQTGRFDIDSAAIRHLADALKLGRLDGIEEHLNEVFSSLYSCEYNMLMSALSFLTSSVFNALHLIEKNSTLSFDADFVAFGRRVSSLETLEEIRLEYMKLFRRAVERMSQRKDQNTGSIVTGVVQYIEANYRDRNLCTDALADKFSLTPAYLGRLFRESMSKSISDYISDVRISKAKGLLEGGSHTVDEILDRIGWENKKYFYTVFKKNFGVTPTEYRLKSRMAK